jgi:hypothetical protein
MHSQLRTDRARCSAHRCRREIIRELRPASFRDYMNWKILLLILLVPTVCQAETFEERVKLAKAAQQDDAYKRYVERMYENVNQGVVAVMHACFTDVKKAQAFKLVADITGPGKLQAVEVKPATTAAKCFADGVREILFPTPPRYPQRKGFPIVMEMNIAP